MCNTFKERYPHGAEFRQRLAELQSAPDFQQLRQEALLANPLLDFDRLLLIKRTANKLGLPNNYEGNSSLTPVGYTNEIAVLSPVRPDGNLSTLFRPEGGRFAGDVRLHFDADRLLFSMPGTNLRWQIFEIKTDGSGLHALPLINEPDVDNYDACYLPGGRIIFSSTAPFTGVPCVRGSAHVANLYRLDPDGTIRQLTVEQDHDWCPTPLPNGRVLYLRWEYTDLPHAFSRILFHMNPDGTEQMEFYGSNSYWPASMFYAKPLPGHATQFVAIVGGHHELPRMGDLVVFDTAKGRFEADGAVQRIPGRGRKVEPAMLTCRSSRPGRNSFIRFRSAKNIFSSPASHRKMRSGAFTWPTYSTTSCSSASSLGLRCSNPSRSAKRCAHRYSPTKLSSDGTMPRSLSRIFMQVPA